MSSSGAVMLFWIFSSVAAVCCLVIYADLDKYEGRERLAAVFCIVGGALAAVANVVVLGFVFVGNLDITLADNLRMAILVLGSLFGGIGFYLVLRGGIALYESSTDEKAKRG